MCEVAQNPHVLDLMSGFAASRGYREVHAASVVATSRLAGLEGGPAGGVTLIALRDGSSERDQLAASATRT